MSARPEKDNVHHGWPSFLGVVSKETPASVKTSELSLLPIPKLVIPGLSDLRVRSDGDSTTLHSKLLPDLRLICTLHRNGDHHTTSDTVKPPPLLADTTDEKGEPSSAPSSTSVAPVPIGQTPSPSPPSNGGLVAWLQVVVQLVHRLQRHGCGSCRPYVLWVSAHGDLRQVSLRPLATTRLTMNADSYSKRPRPISAGLAIQSLIVLALGATVGPILRPGLLETVDLGGYIRSRIRTYDVVNLQGIRASCSSPRVRRWLWGKPSLRSPLAVVQPYFSSRLGLALGLAATGAR
ncbi:hypothetical protein BDW72DRAFT_197159 [Aspergillus terricola var. indicus]